NLPTFVCVLPPTLRRGSVQMILRTLSCMFERDLVEKVACGASPRYPKQLIQDRGWGPIIFGCDPYLTARRVDNLRVVCAGGKEDLHFVVHDERDINGRIMPPRSLVLRHGRRMVESAEERMNVGRDQTR